MSEAAEAAAAAAAACESLALGPINWEAGGEIDLVEQADSGERETAEAAEVTSGAVAERMFSGDIIMMMGSGRGRWLGTSGPQCSTGYIISSGQSSLAGSQSPSRSSPSTSRS